MVIQRRHQFLLPILDLSRGVERMYTRGHCEQFLLHCRSIVSGIDSGVSFSSQPLVEYFLDPKTLLLTDLKEPKETKSTISDRIHKILDTIETLFGHLFDVPSQLEQHGNTVCL